MGFRGLGLFYQGAHFEESAHRYAWLDDQADFHVAVAAEATNEIDGKSANTKAPLKDGKLVLPAGEAEYRNVVLIPIDEWRGGNGFNRAPSPVRSRGRGERSYRSVSGAPRRPPS